MFDRGFAQTTVDAGIDVESNDAAREILYTRSRSICGERKKFGNTRQLTCPVLELTGKSAVRFVDPTESPLLPDSEVRVLDWKRDQSGASPRCRAEYAVITSNANGAIENPSAQM
ncbi:hypothetical protein GCM10020255_081960 [Rhodococcus baikonurensis]